MYVFDIKEAEYKAVKFIEFKRVNETVKAMTYNN